MRQCDLEEQTTVNLIWKMNGRREVALLWPFISFLSAAAAGKWRVSPAHLHSHLNMAGLYLEHFIGWKYIHPR